MWARTLPLVGDFPLWGSGLRTFQYLEPLSRGPSDDNTVFWNFAHNDYLQLLGGVLFWRRPWLCCLNRLGCEVLRVFTSRPRSTVPWSNRPRRWRLTGRPCSAPRKKSVGTTSWPNSCTSRGRLAECRRELVIILAQQPGHAKAQAS